MARLSGAAWPVQGMGIAVEMFTRLAFIAAVSRMCRHCDNGNPGGRDRSAAFAASNGKPSPVRLGAPAQRGGVHGRIPK